MRWLRYISSWLMLAAICSAAESSPRSASTDTAVHSAEFMAALVDEPRHDVRLAQFSGRTIEAPRPPTERIAPPPLDPGATTFAPQSQPGVDFPPPLSAYDPFESHWYDNRGCPQNMPWYRIYEGSNFGLPCYHDERSSNGFLVDGVVRAFYHNDQRVRWSGNETTFGAEGVLTPRLIQHADAWTVSANGVFFLNQPFDGNMLTDPSRDSYHGNFQPQPFYLWNLNVAVSYEDLRVVFGKDQTPFGRMYSPLQTNARYDAPFIRTEAIGFNETGVFFHYEPDWMVGDLAIVNGSTDQDTNSDKGLVARLGLRRDDFAAGISGKLHDGVGSEHQKRRDNQFGFDWLFVRGNWDLSGEMIYDEYGYRKPEFNPQIITWGRSIYYRDIYNGRVNGRLTGLGYYFNLGYVQPRYRIDLNFGEYYPRAIGNPLHDPMNRRFLIKSTVLLLPRFEALTTLIFENKRPVVEAFRSNYAPFALFCGVQTYF